jgi:hypothetical protein
MVQQEQAHAHPAEISQQFDAVSARTLAELLSKSGSSLAQDAIQSTATLTALDDAVDEWVLSLCVCHWRQQQAHAERDCNECLHSAWLPLG